MGRREGVRTRRIPSARYRALGAAGEAAAAVAGGDAPGEAGGAGACQGVCVGVGEALEVHQAVELLTGRHGVCDLVLRRRSEGRRAAQRGFQPGAAAQVRRREVLRAAWRANGRGCALECM